MMKILKTVQNVKLNQDNDNSDDNGQSKTGVATKIRSKTQKPSMYKVLLLNDDYTPMEFVVEILTAHTIPPNPPPPTPPNYQRPPL